MATIEKNFETNREHFLIFYKNFSKMKFENLNFFEVPKMVNSKSRIL